MDKPIKAMKSSVLELEGCLVIAFTGQDETGRSVSVAISADGLDDFFSDAQRKLSAYRAQKERQSSGEWRTAVARPGAPCRVAVLPTDEGEKVVLIVHPDMVTELTLWFDREDAFDLGTELAETAEQLG